MLPVGLELLPVGHAGLPLHHGIPAPRCCRLTPPQDAPRMPFQQIECAFLKDEVGPILAKGLAETVIACPTDPVEYLGEPLSKKK